MNEMGDLADGDLTIRATVTEDITGAIADSVNYTVEELRMLVAAGHDTVTRVARRRRRWKHLHRTALGHRAAARNSRNRQSVLDMAASINVVSSQAQESARWRASR
jgi:twitching motility protein PilJ